MQEIAPHNVPTKVLRLQKAHTDLDDAIESLLDCYSSGQLMISREALLTCLFALSEEQDVVEHKLDQEAAKYDT